MLDAGLELRKSDALPTELTRPTVLPLIPLLTFKCKASTEHTISEALPRGVEQGNKVIYFRGTREQKSKTEVNRGTKAILGNREHRKSRV